MKTLPIGYRLAAFFGSRADSRLSVMTAARHAHRVVELARKLDRINSSIDPTTSSEPVEQTRIRDIVMQYLVGGERIVFGLDARGPAVRIISDKLPADCIGGGTAIR